MRLKARLRREWRFLRGLSRTLSRVKGIESASTNLICDDLQAAVDEWRGRPALTFEDRSVTYGELDAIANRFARWGRGAGLRKGQTVALFMPNRLEYLCIWYGLSKIGVVTALINNQLGGAALAHCLNLSGASHVIVDPDTQAAFEAAQGQLERPFQEWVLGSASGAQRDLAQALKSCSQLPPDRSAREDVKAGDTALLIFTSGTTGLPKAARITHVRAQLYMRGFAAGTDAGPNDRLYCCLPLYHATGGLCAVGAALLTGATLVLKRKFSASSFWDDIVAEEATLFVYIGELCRYLVNQPEVPAERMHSLRLIFGNGLSLDVWNKMLSRFRIPNILEFYGATEGNVSLLNFDGKPGAVGRVPSYLRKSFNVKLIRFDVETELVERGANGLCIECRPGEIGLTIGEIKSLDARYAYAGYADKTASDRKVLRDVLARGDAWFATGDLMRQDREGYFYFVDRVGDTFRWKGENVSTGEVAAHLAEVHGVLEANVYGVAVPGTEGRAGMAALVTDHDRFDLAAFRSHVDATLPPYARPLFLRLQPQIVTTGTFKYRKIDLAADGFDPGAVADPLYFKDPEGAYVPLDAALFARIKAGEVRV